MQKVFEMVRKASQSRAPVIITGESGTGKDLVANAIHLCGARKDKPFIQLNCAALNEAMLESELFGHARGAFTGAYRNRVGDIAPIHADVRVITATNKNLEALIARNEFREDLFFRINVIPIAMPPLRERIEDIPLLINTCISRLNESTGKAVAGVSTEAMDRMISYAWPGNVRELKNTMEYAFVTCEGEIVRLDHLPRRLTRPEPTAFSSSPRAGASGTPVLDEKAQLISALRATGGNQTQAARLLKVNRVTVWNRMKKYGVDLGQIL